MTNQSQLLEQKIHETIPLSRTLGYHIESLTGDSIQVVAPLEPNINIHNAAFAGSLYSVAALTAWGLVTHIVNEAGIEAAVVIGKAEILYQRPITEAIYCRSTVTPDISSEFLSTLAGAGRAKLLLTVAIGNQSEASLDAVVFATCAE